MYGNPIEPDSIHSTSHQMMSTPSTYPQQLTNMHTMVPSLGGGRSHTAVPAQAHYAVPLDSYTHSAHQTHTYQVTLPSRHSVSVPHAPSYATSPSNQPSRRPNEVFVGDLSFFCREQDLVDFFSLYGRVVTCHVVLNDNRTRSLMYGFVTMSNEQEAIAAASKINNQLFMGRTIK